MSSNGDLVNVAIKVLELRMPKTVGAEKWQIAEAIIADKSGIMQLDLWGKYIGLVIPGKTYMIKGLLKREWHSKKTLCTTRETEIQEHKSGELESINPECSQEVDGSKTINVDHVSMLEKIEVYKKCANGKCNKKVMQASSKVILKCDRCGYIMRMVDCPNGVCVKILVKESTSSDESYHLIIFEKVLATLVNDYCNENEVAEKLLLLDNFSITFDPMSKIVTSLSLK